MAGFKKRSEEEILAILAEIRDRKDDIGRWQDARETLDHAVTFAEGVHRSEHARLMTASLRAWREIPAGTASDFLAAVSRAESEHLRLPSQDFRLATDLLVQSAGKSLSRRLLGSYIWLGPAHSAAYDRTHAATEAVLSSQVREDALRLQDATAVRVHVSARTEREAGETALARLGTLLGVWNFLLRAKRLTCTPWRPLAYVRLGPLHTLHEPDGSPLRSWWFQPSFASGTSRDLGDAWTWLKKHESRVRKATNRLRYSDDLYNVFLGYSDALEEAEPRAAFLMLWSVFERLLSGGAQLKQDALIRRALFLTPRAKELYYRQQLRFLVDRRNDFAHPLYLQDSGDPDPGLQLLRDWVCDLIRFHLFWAPPAISFEEAAARLDHPRDAGLLRDRARGLGWAITYRARIGS